MIIILMILHNRPSLVHVHVPFFIFLSLLSPSLVPSVSSPITGILDNVSELKEAANSLSTDDPVPTPATSKILYNPIPYNNLFYKLVFQSIIFKGF